LFSGSKNIIILVDSIEKQGTLNLSHFRFDKIEVIQRPQGQYAGYDVLINLHTKEDYEGYEGALSQVGAIKPNSEYTKDSYFTTSNAYFSYTKRKWTFFASGWFYYARNKFDRWYDDYYPLNGIRNEVISNLDGTKNLSAYERYYNCYASLDYQINKYRSLSFTYAYNGKNTEHYYNRTINRTYENAGTATQLRQRNNSFKDHGEHSVAVFYRDNGSIIKWNTDFNYRYTPSSPQNTTEETTGFTLDNHFRDKMNYTRFRLNGWTELCENHLTLNAGYINTWKEYSRKDYDSRQELNSNSYLRNQLWANVSWRFNNNARLTVGGWAEHVHAKSNGTSDNQVPFGGNFMAFYQLSKKNWMRLNYNCNVDYPDQGLSSEYGYFTDSLTWSGGNPKIKTSVRHDIHFWIDLWWCFNFQTGYIYAPNVFNSIAEVREGTLSNGQYGTYVAYQWQNTKYKEWWASVSFTKRFLKDFLYKADVKYRNVRASYAGFSNNYDGIEGSTSINWYSDKLKLNVNFSYQYMRQLGVTPQSMNVSNVEYPTLNIEKTFFNQRLSVQFSWEHIFHLFNSDIKYSEISSLYVCTIRLINTTTGKRIACA